MEKSKLDENAPYSQNNVFHKSSIEHIAYREVKQTACPHAVNPRKYISIFLTQHLLYATIEL